MDMMIEWNQTKRITPVSNMMHGGRVNAPNYHKEFSEKLLRNRGEFHRRKNECTELCRIEKSYGVDRLFRKYK